MPTGTFPAARGRIASGNVPASARKVRRESVVASMRRTVSQPRMDTKASAIDGLRRDHASDAILEVRAPVRGDRGDDVAHPTEQPASADPEAGRQDQPEQSTQEVAVVELADARNDEAQDRRGACASWRHDDSLHITDYA